MTRTHSHSAHKTDYKNLEREFAKRQLIIQWHISFCNVLFLLFQFSPHRMEKGYHISLCFFFLNELLSSLLSYLFCKFSLRTVHKLPLSHLLFRFDSFHLLTLIPCASSGLRFGRVWGRIQLWGLWWKWKQTWWPKSMSSNQYHSETLRHPGSSAQIH